LGFVGLGLFAGADGDAFGDALRDALREADGDAAALAGVAHDPDSSGRAVPHPAAARATVARATAATAPVKGVGVRRNFIGPSWQKCPDPVARASLAGIERPSERPGYARLGVEVS
jgi:hypothetical protein